MEVRLYNPHERNWMQEQSLVISLVIQKSQKGICLIVLIIVRKLLEHEMSNLFLATLVGVLSHVM